MNLVSRFRLGSPFAFLPSIDLQGRVRRVAQTAKESLAWAKETSGLAGYVVYEVGMAALSFCGERVQLLYSRIYAVGQSVLLGALRRENESLRKQLEALPQIREKCAKLEKDLQESQKKSQELISELADMQVALGIRTRERDGLLSSSQTSFSYDFDAREKEIQKALSKLIGEFG